MLYGEVCRSSSLDNLVDEPCSLTGHLHKVRPKSDKAADGYAFPELIARRQTSREGKLRDPLAINPCERPSNNEKALSPPLFHRSERTVELACVPNVNWYHLHF